MTNLTQDIERKGILNSEGYSMLNNTKGDPSRQGHITRTTEYTSNIGMNTTNADMHAADRAVASTTGAAHLF